MLTFQQIVEKIDSLEEAHILLAAIEFHVFTILGKRKMTPKAIAKKAETHPQGTEMLLHALAAMGALKKRNGTFENTPDTYKHLCEKSPDYKKGIVALRKDHRKEWMGLIRTIRSGRDLSEFEGGDDPEFRTFFTHAMHERSERYSAKVAKIVARQPVGRLLDTGGGPGSYSAAILKRDKKATATLLDRPATLKVARELLQSTSVFNRFEFISGDFFEEDWGRGFDTIFYSNILHIYNPQENKQLFRKACRSLVKGGRFILVDLFLKENRIEPYAAALFSLTMLLFTATGKTYSFKETETMLRQTGFASFKRFDLSAGSSLIEAVKK